MIEVIYPAPPKKNDFLTTPITQHTKRQNSDSLHEKMPNLFDPQTRNQQHHNLIFISSWLISFTKYMHLFQHFLLYICSVLLHPYTQSVTF